MSNPDRVRIRNVSWHDISDEELASAFPDNLGVVHRKKRAFDQPRCVEVLRQALPDTPGTSTHSFDTSVVLDDWGWSINDKPLAGLLSATEARFWLKALTSPTRLTATKDSDFATNMGRFQATRAVELDTAQRWFQEFIEAANQHYGRWPRSSLAPTARLLTELFGPESLRVILRIAGAAELRPFVRFIGEFDEESQAEAGKIANRFVASVDLDGAAIDGVSALLTLAPDNDAIGFVAKKISGKKRAAVFEEAMLEHTRHEAYVDFILEHRLELSPNRLLRALALSGPYRLDDIASRITRMGRGARRESIQVLERVRHAHVTEAMLKLSDDADVGDRARAWLQAADRPIIERLVELAAKGKLADRAVQWLRELSSDDRRVLVEKAIDDSPRKLRDRLRPQVLEYQQLTAQEAATSSLPNWLNAVADRANADDLALAGDLPALLTKDGTRVPTRVFAGVLALIREASLGFDGRAGQPRDNFELALLELSDATDPMSAGIVGRALFDVWVRRQNPAQERWHLFAMAYLHSDYTPYFLADAVLNYTRWMKLTDALHTIDVLRVIGNDHAAIALTYILQRSRNGKICELTQQTVNYLADQNRLTLEAFLDRNIPDCGLGPHGRMFEFGGRTYRLGMSGAQRLLLVDTKSEKTRIRIRPTTNDERAASLEFDRLVLQTERVVETQAQRLESAMTTGRTWPADLFRSRLAAHPILRVLAQALVWKQADEELLQIATFRVADDLTYSGLADDEVELFEGDWVAVAHPAEMNADEILRWNELFADYEIVQPFGQLDRQVFRHDARGKAGFRSPAGMTVDGLELWEQLRDLNWEPVRTPTDTIFRFEKPFPMFKTVVRLNLERPIDIMAMKRGGLAPRKAQLAGLTFVDDTTAEEIDPTFVHPVVFSEALVELACARGD